MYPSSSVSLVAMTNQDHGMAVTLSDRPLNLLASVKTEFRSSILVPCVGQGTLKQLINAGFLDQPASKHG